MERVSSWSYLARYASDDLGIGDGVDPVLEAEQELAVVVGEAGEEVEVVGTADRADGAGGDAQVAPVARVVVERLP